MKNFSISDENQLKTQSSFFDKNLILNGSCYDLMQVMPENSIDLILTDPPYILNSSPTKAFKNAKLYGSESFKEICNGYDIDLFLRLCVRVCKKMNVFVFCSNSQIAKIMQWALDNKYFATLLVWHKQNSIPFCASSWRPDLEFVIHIRESGSYFNGNIRISSKLYSSPTNPSQYGHPTEKPIPLLAKLIQAGSKEGDFVLDPFAGSGTTIVAALKLKRRALGFEIKEEYCQLTQKRINDFLNQNDFFL